MVLYRVGSRPEMAGYLVMISKRVNFIWRVPRVETTVSDLVSANKIAADTFLALYYSHFLNCNATAQQWEAIVGNMQQKLMAMAPGEKFEDYFLLANHDRGYRVQVTEWEEYEDESDEWRREKERKADKAMEQGSDSDYKPDSSDLDEDSD
ncbi:MAG: hypothetical protein Q9181_003855 [Wetmoreana brouardii]